MNNKQKNYIKDAYKDSGFSYQEEAFEKLEETFIYRGSSDILKESLYEPGFKSDGDCDFITFVDGDHFESGMNIVIFWQAKRAKNKVTILEEITHNIHEPLFVDRGTYDSGKKIKPNQVNDLYKAFSQLERYNVELAELNRKFSHEIKDGYVRVDAVVTESEIRDIHSRDKLGKGIYRIRDERLLYVVEGVDNIKLLLKNVLEVWKLQNQKGYSMWGDYEKEI